MDLGSLGKGEGKKKIYIYNKIYMCIYIFFPPLSDCSLTLTLSQNKRVGHRRLCLSINAAHLQLFSASKPTVAVSHVESVF